MKTTARVLPFALPITVVVILACLFFRGRAQIGPPPGQGPTPIQLAGWKLLEDRPVIDAETQQLNSLLATAAAAANSITPGVDAGAQRRAIDLELCSELETFVTNSPASPWAPAVHLALARRAELRCGYSLAMDHYEQAFAATEKSIGPIGRSMAVEASGGLAKLLALTGQLATLDVLEAAATDSLQFRPNSPTWEWAREMHRWVSKHPNEAYKCGLYCLDQLGRLTQPGQFLPKNITEVDGSTNGFSAADLLTLGASQGLRIHAAILTDFSNLPVPCILHLRSEHFVIVVEQRGALYEIFDPVACGPRWLTGAEIAQEGTGCVLVSDAVPPMTSVHLASISASAAVAYRGRCHNPLPTDHNDSGCPTAGGGPGGSKLLAGDDPSKAGNCSAGCSSGSNQQDRRQQEIEKIEKAIQQAGQLPLGGVQGASAGPTIQSGMPQWGVSDPYLNVWIKDTPMTYRPGYGPGVDFNLGYHSRNYASVISGSYWHGARIGQASLGVWSCSWLSFAELDSADATVDLMLPAGGWATFTFPSGSSISSINYQHNLWLQKVANQSGAITNLVLFSPDGSQISYGVYDKSDSSYDGVFYMTAQTDPNGNKTTFAYDASFNLTTVTAVDGTTFTIQYSTAPNISGVTSSYGSSVTIYYGYQYGILVTNIIDAAGLSSQFGYEDPVSGGNITQLITPYGTTGISTAGSMNNGTNYYYGVFDRTVAVTNADGTVEFYAQMNTYTGSSWPNYLSAQIPTNTPIGTLDKDNGNRQERNTFYWNAQQFASIANLNLAGFDWAQFKLGRIRHWLASTATDTGYTHWDTLSSEQAPSPDGGSTEGQLTWYDYIGKPSGVDYERGVQTLPSLIARVMPDGSTWYQYFTRSTNGLPTHFTEAWINPGGVSTRTEGYGYAANNIDLVAWTNALGVLASSNAFNAFHQVTTNYDALSQKTIFSYDGATHQITNISYASGLTTAYTYNGSHRLQQISDQPINRIRSYTWNSDGTMASSTDERGLTVNYYWDGLHRPTGTRYPDTTGTTNLYYLLSGTPYPNSSGGTGILDITATKDRMNNWTYFAYDAVRRKIAETNANGAVTGYGYCSCGGLAYLTNAWNTVLQQLTIFNYDYQGHPVTINYADGYNVTNWFDSLGRKIVTGDGAANRWLYYDNLGRLTTVSNTYGAEQVTTYDVLNRPVYVTDANGIMTTNTYDNLNRVLTRGYPDGGVEKFGYSARGIIAYTNQIGMTNFFGYDEAGRKTAETNANSEKLFYTNNAAGDLLSLTDGKGQTTKWNYDEYGRVTNKVDQVGTVILKYVYDADSRRTNRWSTAKGNTYYTYDGVGNLTFINYPSSTDVTLQYDLLNRLTNMVDAAGTTKYTYTAGNQLLTEDGPFTSDIVTNAYSNRLRTKLSLQQPAGVWTNVFVYDGAAHLTNVTSPAGVFSYFLGASSPGSWLAKRIALPNTSYITNTFDNVARLTGTYLDNNTGTVLDSATYGYNKANQRTVFTNASGLYYQFSYDNINQLVIADSSLNTEDRGYFYDSAWNLNRRTNNGTSFTFSVDTKNQLTNWPNGGSFTFDGNGNMLSQNTAAINNTYDDENRLTSSENDDKHTWRTDFIYDGLGRLRKRLEYNWTGSAWTESYEIRYVYDGWRVIQERDINNTPLVAYTRGADLSGTLEGAGGIGGLLARSFGYSSGNWSTHDFYHADGNGNITYLADGSQSLAASYRYDPFGNILSSSGTLAATNSYRFSSKEFMINSTRYYYGYRFYDPNLQRWLNRDPLTMLFPANGGRVLRMPWEAAAYHNAYTYVLNQPTVCVDVNGLWTFGVGISGSFNIWIFNGTFSIGLTGDTQGNLNWWGTYGGGATGAGGGASIGVTIQVSNAACNSDLAGPFGYGSAGGFLGGGASVDTFYGNGSAGQPVFGGGFTVGPGLGAGATSGYSTTEIKPLWPF